MVTILAIGGMQALFFSFLLFNKKNRSQPDLILALWLFVLFLQISSNYLEYSGYYERFPHLVGSTSSLVFLYGPFLYLYVQIYMTGDTTFKPIDYLHFAPFILYNLLLIPFYIQSGPEKLAYHQEVISEAPGFWLSLGLVFKIISLPVYLVLALVLLKRHGKNISQLFAHTEQIDLKWLKYLIWSMAVVGLLVLVLSVVKIASGGSFETEKYIFSAATFWIFGIGFYGLKQAPIFVGPSIHKDDALQASKTKTRAYEKNKIKESDADRYQQLLLQYMKTDKPYLKNKLTLDQLAEAIEIPSHHLSQLLNERLGQNFFDFINRYRIDEFKSQIGIPENQNLTLLGIALNCGFNSKATFNRIFKKHTGFTPTEYMENDKKG